MDDQAKGNEDHKADQESKEQPASGNRPIPGPSLKDRIRKLTTGQPSTPAEGKPPPEPPTAAAPTQPPTGDRAPASPPPTPAPKPTPEAVAPQGPESYMTQKLLDRQPERPAAPVEMSPAESLPKHIEQLAASLPDAVRSEPLPPAVPSSPVPPATEKVHEATPPAPELRPISGTEMLRATTQPEGAVTPWQIILQTLGTEPKVFGAEIRRPTVIGRVDPHTNVQVDLDMTPYGAAELGMSRQHAILLPSSEGLWIVDLDSTNGTWINGLFLQPGMKYRLRSGDRIEFGSLTVQVRVLGEAAPVPHDTDRPGSTQVSRQKPKRG